MSATYEVGDVVRLTFAVSVNGAPTNATVALAITLPDGTTVSPTPDNPATGSYRYDFLASQNGRHVARWTATGTATAAQTEAFTIGGLVSLDDAKAHLQMRTDVNDAELQRFIWAADAAVAQKVGPLAPVTVTERTHGGGTSIVLRQWPVRALTSVTYWDGSTVDVSNLDLDTDAGVLYWQWGTSGYFTAGTRNVTVTYTAGWDQAPADLEQAVLELVRHLWETQRGNNTPARPGFTDEPAVPGAFSSWPVRVQELLAPYIVPRVA